MGSHVVSYGETDMSKNNTLPALGSRVREQRLKQKLTEEALAKRAQVTTQLVAAIERGEKDVSFECLLRLANALDTTAADLCRGIDG